MDLGISDHTFIVCGASSGFGEAITRQLVKEGADIIAVARRGDLLEDKYANFEKNVTPVEGSLIYSETLDKIMALVKKREIHGIVFNAGGPPTGTPLQTTMADWDASWQLVMRWKIDLALRLAPIFKEKGYGRVLFIESQSVKQPLPALTLSNAFRAGVTGFAKTLALELAKHGVTVNVLAPGSHETPAIERVIKNNSSMRGVSYDEAKQEMEQNIPVGRLGKAEEFASLAAWLLSPHSSYITGQTISHDGGSISGLFG